jgi:ABC-type nitrate/sulfonate/bicarbonate transport system substrate-binding protein
MLLRRTLQYGGGVMMLGPTASFLAACGGDDGGGSADAATTPTTAAGGTSPATTAAGGAPADLGALDYRLSWIKNVEFAGSYIADTNGYYTAEGFSSVNLIAGGPSAQPSEVDVSSGAAFVGVSGPDVTASAILAGSDLKVIAAQYQKNPFCVMSLASNPITTPEEMYGKKFGLQSANQVIWDAFVAASGIDDSKIEKFPAQFDPTPLVNGECDCWFSFITNEPNLLEIEGIETVTFLIADFGYPLVSETLVVKTESITNERAKVKAFLKAEIMGWRDSLKDPALGATLTVEKYGSDLGLTVEEQTLESQAQNDLLLTDETKVNGLMTLSDTLLAEQITTLKAAGIDITAEQLFDMSVIEEVYAENPDLKTPPV